MIFLRGHVKYMVNTQNIRRNNNPKNLYTIRYINQLAIKYSYELSFKVMSITFCNNITEYDISYEYDISCYNSNDNHDNNNSNDSDKYNDYLGIWSYITIRRLNKEICIDENVHNYDSYIKILLYTKHNISNLYTELHYKTESKYRLYYQNIKYLNIVY